MKQFLVSTTGNQSPVILNDLAGIEIVHPTTDLDLLQQFSLEEIQNSQDLQNAIDNNWLTIKDETGETISNVQEEAEGITQKELNKNKEIIISFFGGNNYYKATKNTSWKTVGQFIFRGTNIVIPSKIKAIIWLQNSSVKGGIRIYDFTNGKEIAKKEDITNISPQIINLGDLQNLPTDESIIEIQIRRVSGPALQVRISSLIINFD